MLLRLAYLGVTSALAMSDHAKDAEILALHHQITVLERQLHGDKPRVRSTSHAQFGPGSLEQ